MSWLFGAVGSINTQILESFPMIHPSHLYLFANKNLYIAAGGIKETCNFGYFNRENFNGWKSWAACGIGLISGDSGSSFISESAWEKILSENTPNFKELNGHFVCIRRKDYELQIFTDCLGVRDIHIAKNGDLLLFSTRPDWLAKFIGDVKIDFSVFGSRWLLENQISCASILTKIDRFTAGSQITLKPNNYTSIQNPWLPEIRKDVTQNSIVETLSNFMTAPTGNTGKISLALSGGMDSRLALALLLSSGYKNFETFTFGNFLHPDSVIASKLAKELNISHKIYDEPLPQQDELIDSILDFSVQTQAAYPVSEYSYKRYYPELYKNNAIIIDGGFGEIIRRGLYKRISFFGRDALLKKDIKKIIPYLFKFRADFFTQEVKDIMNNGILRQLNEFYNKMPDIIEFGVENWLDLLSVRTKLINYCALEQARTDNYAVSYTPFSQQKALNLIFSILLNERKNGKMTRNIIRNSSPILRKYPLVKGNFLVPYYFTDKMSWVYRKLKQIFGNFFHDPTSENFTFHLKEFILDIVNSANVRECSYYDYEKLKKYTESFYSGKTEYASQLDWWLAFELFRKQIED